MQTLTFGYAKDRLQPYKRLPLAKCRGNEAPQTGSKASAGSRFAKSRVLKNKPSTVKLYIHKALRSLCLTGIALSLIHFHDIFGFQMNGTLTYIHFYFIPLHFGKKNNL